MDSFLGEWGRALAKAQRDATERMSACAASADRELPGWVESAARALREFAKAWPGTFTVEHARLVIQRNGLPIPRELRAWGAATRVARRRKYIEPVPGLYLPTVSGSGHHAPCYRRGLAA